MKTNTLISFISLDMVSVFLIIPEKLDTIRLHYLISLHTNCTHVNKELSQ